MRELSLADDGGQCNGRGFVVRSATMNPTHRYAASQVSLSGAISLIPKGKYVFVGSGAAEPSALVEELVRQEGRFADNTIVHLLTLGPAPYVAERYKDRFRHNAFFIGPNVREAVSAGRADYTPVFLSQIPGLIRARRLPVDVALIQVSPPDAFGFVNLGVSVDVVLSAVESAELVIAEVNPNMPVIHGAGFIPMDRIDAWVDHPSALPVHGPDPLDDVAREIGRNVATLVEDGSTLQVGIGQVPDAVLAALEGKSDLGVWTEMLSDGVVDLIQNGNITGRFKSVEPRKVSSSFTFGSRKTYDFVDRNPVFQFGPSDYINDPVMVARQHKMVAVNSALQIDLTGQVCSDSIGTRFYSGIGGQVDFIRGAAMCPGGKAIIAIRSTAKKGEISRIVPTLDQGAGVVTSRGDVHYVVTEYGIADLRGRSIRERALELISIAHPDFRHELTDQAKERRYVFADQLEPRTTYRRDHERRLVTRDDVEVLLRPVKETDESKLRDMFYTFSETTIYKRFMAHVVALPHHKLMEFLRVDDRRNVAIVIEREPEGQESELLGIGRYHVDPSTQFAEVAFVIRDAWQGKGLGTALLTQLISIARENDVRGFTAEVLVSNASMLHVFHKSGLSIRSSLDTDTYSLEMPFEPVTGATMTTLSD